jgi:protein disulfide-isomerase A1
MTYYSGGRTSNDLVNHMFWHTSPHITTLTTPDEFNKFITFPTSVKLIIRDEIDGELSKLVTKHLKMFKELLPIAIDKINDPSPTKESISMTLYRDFDDNVVKYNGNLNTVTVREIIQFINTNSIPLMGEINPQTYKTYLKTGLPLVWVFINYSNKNEMNLVQNELTILAQKVKDRCIFGHVNGIKWSNKAKEFGLGNSSMPGIVIDDAKKQKKWVYNGVFDVDSVEDWINKVLLNKIHPTLRSEPIPIHNNGPVITLVGNTFRQTVLDNDKDVFVQHYSKFCTRCSGIKEPYNEIGLFYQNDNDIIIAQIEVNDNDVETPYVIDGYPLLYLWGKHNKDQPILYEGKRTVEDMKEFLEKYRGKKVGEDENNGKEVENGEGKEEL